jgi:xanthine dehydrogenase accessory factor
MPLAPIDWFAEPGAHGALVTVVAIEGSAPRRVGTQLWVPEVGAVVGSLSGGCLDEAVAELARQALAAGRDQSARFGPGSPFVDLALPCGSALQLEVDVSARAALRTAVRQRRAARLPIALCWPEPGGGVSLDGGAALTIEPPLKLIVAGAGEALKLLVNLAEIARFDVDAYTPDAALAAAIGGRCRVLAHRQQRFDFALDRRCAALTLFHDHEWEVAFLRHALAAPDALLIGAMGSARAHAARCERLLEAGVARAALDRLTAPIGLIKRTRDAAALAVSILAQLIDRAG